jgi:Bacterial membrane protein YfhO
VGAPGFDARQEVVLVGDRRSDEAAALTAGPPDSLREAAIERDAPEDVALDVHSDRPAVLVLTDPLAPGWTATVNGRTAPVLAANYLGRGVIVPAGESRVEFSYRAPGLRAGLLVALLGWTLVIAGAALRTWRTRASTATTPGQCPDHRSH